LARLLIVGLGYSGEAIARLAIAEGFEVMATTRRARQMPAGVVAVPFAQAADAIATATHLIATAPPGQDGDPALALFGGAVAAAAHLQWIGYLSTTGVYGDRGGDWVDEDTPPAPGLERSRRRLAAENAWREAAGGRPLDIMRLAGIYGPGRSALDEVRSGHARRVILPGHQFGRIHVDDIAGGTMAALRRPPQGARILNFSDDVPAESAAVLEEAARLLGVPPPPAIPFAEAVTSLSDMGRSFWSENRKVASRKTQAALVRPWNYPGFREGLAAILCQERGEGLA
jgi:nucleoside-diphosphate-sugar epimerase